MRGLVAILLLLASAKLGAQYYLASSAKTEIIVAAYRERAQGACERVAKARRVAAKGRFVQTGEVQLLVGKPDIGVQLWQVDNKKWQARFKNPYLLVTFASDHGHMVCEYDVMAGDAHILPLQGLIATSQ